ncbi:hypothetical protein [Streptomyces sp. NPDC048603]|uniref:hypothetical protein n=1 Tax=Streptomyces sp. NPDC048603 TaxID=3365577 RepID=UPI0037113C78
MIHISETLVLQTVEEFLTDDDLARLLKIMDAEQAATGWKPRFQAEVIPAPAAARDILQAATLRALPAIRRSIPSATAAAKWAYTELGPGDEIQTHLDGIPHPERAPRRIGRIGVVVQAAEAGGEFYVETTSSPGVWSGLEVGESEGYLAGTPLTHVLEHAPDRADLHETTPEWLAGAARSRWTSHAGPGVAVAYGAQVIHGVTPVRSGRLRKFVANLCDTP